MSKRTRDQISQGISPYLKLSTLFAAVICLVNLSPALCRADDTPPAAEAATSATYDDPGHWLCRPGRADACVISLDAAIVAEDGSITREAYRADPEASIDCFYVYPTVSHEPTGNSDFAIDRDLSFVAAQQFARFGARCRLFAPVYRQITVPGLIALFSGKKMPIDFELGYHDVRAAWQNYLEKDNHGRGFVLIGHSQGTGVLARLVREEIDGKPVQAQMVSALLIGGALGDVRVRNGDPTEMAFAHIPVCHSGGQIGCVIGFNSFRSESPPEPGKLFEKAPEGTHPVCANPASLSGGAGDLDAYLSTSGAILSDLDPKTPVVWTKLPQTIDAPFVKAPGLLKAHCVDDGKVVYLATDRKASADGHRVDDIRGDVLNASGQVVPYWGLHVVDVNLAMGNLIEIVGEQTKAYLTQSKKN